MSAPARDSTRDAPARWEALIEAFQETLPWRLDDFQVEAMRNLRDHQGVLVSAPTSSGKTVIAEFAVWRGVASPEHLRPPSTQPHRVIYTTPLKALSNQKYRDLRAVHGDRAVGLVTGEHSINEDAPVVVMTTEILRNILYDEPQRVDLVSDVVLDEVHYIDDHPRGTVWEEIIIEAPPHIRFVGLSATISNVAEVAAWMTERRGRIATVVRRERPVPLELWLSVENELLPLFDRNGHAHRQTLERAQNLEGGYAGFRYARRAPDNDLLHVVEELRRARMVPAIYFIFSRRGCGEALARCAVHGLDLTSTAEKESIDLAYETRLNAIEDEDERCVYRAALDPRLLRRGIAMHHAGMLPYAKETVEALFTSGSIKVVFATETLSLGLNMPARACVISSFTKFNGVSFEALTSGELAQFMGRAGRRGIDTVGHGIILKEQDVDIRDIYDAALGGEMSVDSKFSPTYTMALNLLGTRSVAQAEQLLEGSFGQYQNLQRVTHWAHRQRNLEERLEDLRARTYRHPTVACTERTLAGYLHAVTEADEAQAALRRSRRDHWEQGRGGRGRGPRSDPGQRYEQQRRALRNLRTRVNDSPCRRCPFLNDHRANHGEIRSVTSTLRGGREEVQRAAERYRREFTAYRNVLRDGGFIENDRPTELGSIAASLYGESSLIVADCLGNNAFSGLDPAELAATLVMLVAEDRRRDRAGGRHRFPTPNIEAAWRRLRRVAQRLSAIEAEHGLATLRPLSLDYVACVHQWTCGVPLADIEPPGGTDLGDVVKAVKNLYSLLRQMEQGLRRHPLHATVVEARRRMERDLIRRV
ncbi:MAG: DEAD/DEAH box helicase [Candidatus Dormibacteria bacterium]